MKLASKIRTEFEREQELLEEKRVKQLAMNKAALNGTLKLSFWEKYVTAPSIIRNIKKELAVYNHNGNQIIHLWPNRFLYGLNRKWMFFTLHYLRSQGFIDVTLHEDGKPAALTTISGKVPKSRGEAILYGGN